MMEQFLQVLLHYAWEVLPALAIGFLISGIVHELIPADLVQRYLGKPGIQPIFYSALIGTILPVCCWGSLPIAVSFYKKGARLGPILAFLVATPATSISALLVSYSVLGLGFTAYIFCAVIVMGLAVGLTGNLIPYTPKPVRETPHCPHCAANPLESHAAHAPSVRARTVDALRYAFIELPKEIGLELAIGLVLAAIVATAVPLGAIIKYYLSGWFGYFFAVIFGILMYLCSTASVPLIDSLIRQGMNPGAAMALLLIGPVTSYGTLLVLRKEFGIGVLAFFLVALAAISVALGIVFAWAVTGAHLIILPALPQL